MVEDDHPPEKSEGEPGTHEGAEEYEVDIAPPHVQHRREEIGQEAALPVETFLGRTIFNPMVKNDNLK